MRKKPILHLRSSAVAIFAHRSPQRRVRGVLQRISARILPRTIRELITRMRSSKALVSRLCAGGGNLGNAVTLFCRSDLGKNWQSNWNDILKEDFYFSRMQH
jgi:hypothetical protein